MQHTASTRKAAGIRAALALAATLSLGGCGGVDGVSLNGGIFDWMGISEGALSKKSSEPKLAERAPLVLPPDSGRLPEPGSGLAAEKGDVNWPSDPEQRKVAEAKERERLHMAYCRGEVEWQKNLDAQNPQARKSPYGPCPGLGNMIKTGQ